MKKLIINILFLGLLILAGQVLLSLEWQFRFPMVTAKIPAPDLYKPDSEVVAVQPYLKTDPAAGFLWRENVDSSANAKFIWGDQEPCLLSTDQWGFINNPDAISELRSGRAVDMICLGASFMQGASSVFYDFFSLNDSFCYNMATHRHTLPMFNEVLRQYGLPLKPSWVIYELNEASPALISDYLAWKRSGSDWFTFHSGTWSGPAKSTQYDFGPIRQMPAVNGLAIAVAKKLLPRKPASAGTQDEQALWCLNYIRAADSMARKAGARMIVLYIPSKETIFYGHSRMSSIIDELLPRLAGNKITVLDLRKPFNDTGDPRSLYYAVDGHWNRDGMLVAARAVKTIIDSIEQTSGN